ncbi:innexin unc-9-like isoform X1 [Convolutriloba macropyga]|uniref:innexin unc-9-like isoform X1 n=1 Tax=Convolutriloba macropyga TaxID=536237 RepID=UPI003F51EE7C
MISELASKLIQFHSGGYDGDFADRVNFKYTTLLFIVLGILVTTRQFVGDAIVCFTPHEFDGQRSAYADAYCWVSNTYYLPLDSHHDEQIDQIAPRRILYYQWTPLILFLQAIAFAFPHFLWRSIYTSAGVDFEQIVESAVKFETAVNTDRWKELISNVAHHIDRYLELQKDYPRFWPRVRIGQPFGNVLTICYPLVKVGFILNIMGHIWVLKYWLGHDYLFYGYTVIYSFVYLGTSLREVTDLFPRITWCTVETRVLEKVFEWQMHCVLPINLFNEMVYLLVWFWLLFMFVLTVVNLITWLLRLFNFCFLCEPSVYDYLAIGGKLDTQEQRASVGNFVRFYLKSDGHFIINMFSKNTTKVFMVDFVTTLFQIYLDKIRLTNEERNSGGGPGGARGRNDSVVNRKVSQRGRGRKVVSTGPGLRDRQEDFELKTFDPLSSREEEQEGKKKQVDREQPSTNSLDNLLNDQPTDPFLGTLPSYNSPVNYPPFTANYLDDVKSPHFDTPTPPPSTGTRFGIGFTRDVFRNRSEVCKQQNFA